jgi:putative oxidoreductase
LKFWFPKDVAGYGGIFAVAPAFFAWMGAFLEAIGGLLLLIGSN